MLGNAEAIIDRSIAAGRIEARGLPQPRDESAGDRGAVRKERVLAGEENIREVIAYPKTQSGQDAMTNSPIPGDPKAMEELGIKLMPKVE